MSHLPFAITAYLLNALAVLVDKFLLTKRIPDPLIYIFYFSIFSLLAFLLLPLTHPPSLSVWALASLSTLLWTLAAYLMYQAFQIGLISRVVPLIGVLVPIFLLIPAALTSAISQDQSISVMVLILGLVFLTLPDWRGKQVQSREMMLIFLASLLFALSYLVLKQAYSKEQFLTVLVYSRFVLIPVGLVILAVPSLKKRVLTGGGGPKLSLLSKTGLIFLAGGVAGGLSEILLTFSISLANPALVNSLQGIQYGFLFIASLLLAKKFPAIYKETIKNTASLISKILGLLLVSLGLYLLAFASIPTSHLPPPTSNLGVTFSPMYAKYLGLDWQKTYISSLDDLKIRNLRIPTYWSQIENNPGRVDFSEVDFMVQQASLRGVQLIMVVGARQPRWPECHYPDWAKKISISERQQKTLQFIQTTINKYGSNPTITAWQVENEPYASWFGEGCDHPDPQFLQSEVSLVKNLDPKRPIIITDSGEWSLWTKASQNADILGISVYKKAFNPNLGYLDYPFPIWSYILKSKLVGKKTIISELQAEAWTKQGAKETDPDEAAKRFTVQNLKNNVQFAQKTNFSQIYLWGLEWWYFMAEHGHPEYLEYARTIFK